MVMFKFVATVMLGACAIASAQDVLVSGYVQKVILQPQGTENCPRDCPAIAATKPDGTTRVCISNSGGCQTMEVKVDHVYRGEVPGMTRSMTRQFKTYIGEWGPSFAATEEQVVVSEVAGEVWWSPVTKRDGRIYIDPKRLRRIAGVPTATADTEDLVALDEVLARIGDGR